MTSKAEVFDFRDELKLYCYFHYWKMVETSCLRQSKVTWRYFVTAQALISIEFFPVTSSEKALLMAIWRCSLCCRAAEPLGGNSWAAFVRLSVECSVAPWAP